MHTQLALPRRTATHTRRPGAPKADGILHLRTQILVRGGGARGLDEADVLQGDVVARLDRAALQAGHGGDCCGARQVGDGDVVDLHLRVAAVARRAAAAEGRALGDGDCGAAERGGGERGHGHVGDVYGGGRLAAGRGSEGWWGRWAGGLLTAEAAAAAVRRVVDLVAGPGFEVEL